MDISKQLKKKYLDYKYDEANKIHNDNLNIDRLSWYQQLGTAASRNEDILDQVFNPALKERVVSTPEMTDYSPEIKASLDGSRGIYDTSSRTIYRFNESIAKTAMDKEIPYGVVSSATLVHERLHVRDIEQMEENAPILGTKMLPHRYSDISSGYADQYSAFPRSKEAVQDADIKIQPAEANATFELLLREMGRINQ